MPMRPSLPSNLTMSAMSRPAIKRIVEDRVRELVMLDVAYLVIGAAFLGLCGVYAVACDRL